jgi:hypothetical protein
MSSFAVLSQFPTFISFYKYPFLSFLCTVSLSFPTLVLSLHAPVLHVCAVVFAQGQQPFSHSSSWSVYQAGMNPGDRYCQERPL